MSDKAILSHSILNSIGQAIIDKGGATAPMLPSAMPAAIANIPSGGGEWVIQPWIMDEDDPTKLDGWIHLWFHFDYDTTAYAYFAAQYISDGHTFTVDWGDGTVETVVASTAYTTRALSHTYTAKGDYRVDITGYDSVIFNQRMFTGERAMFGIRQMQLGTFDETNGISMLTYAYGLRAVNWVGQMTSIGASVFNGCTSLASVGDLSACTSIGNSAFNGCTSLASVGDLSACTSIGSEVFKNCSSLTSVGDLSACTSIGGSAFINCSSLASVGDLSEVITVGMSAFAYCEKIKNLHFGKLENVLAQNNFAYCYELERVDGLDNLTEIVNWCFGECIKLEYIGPLSSLAKISGGNQFRDALTNGIIDFGVQTSTQVVALDGFTNLPARQTCVIRCADGDFYRSGSTLLPMPT